MLGNNDQIEVDGKKYKTSDLNDAAKVLLENLSKLNAVSKEKTNMIAILTKAKRSYIADLKNEMLKVKSGFNFSE